MRFHVLAIPHTATSKEYSTCAYPQKVLDWCRMMVPGGHTVIHYGHEDSRVECTEHVTVLTADVIRAHYRDHDTRQDLYRREPGVDDHFTANALREIAARKRPHDFLLCFWGLGHKPVADAFGDLLVVEPGIGTNESFAPFRVFESYAIMNYHYGREGRLLMPWYDAVIPCAVDPEDFEFRDRKEDHFLYLGRVMKNKGLDIAIQVTDKIGARLKVAGPGRLEALGYDPIPGHVEVLGPVGVTERRSLLASSRALLAPTYYNEPFGKVVIEALASGTPVVTSDWGGFAETNAHGCTGYRCRTFEQFEWAARNVHRISRAACRRYAIENYSIGRVSAMHEEYYSSLSKVVTGKGFYEPHESRGSLDWLVKSSPAPRRKIAVIFLSAGRLDYLERTLESFHEKVGFGGLEVRKVLVDDMPMVGEAPRDHAAFEAIARRYGIDVLELNTENLGLDGNVARAWSLVPQDCDYVWHQEDDFVFDAPVDVGMMVDALETCPRMVHQIALLRHPVYSWEIEAGGIYRAYPEGTFSDLSYGTRAGRHTLTVHTRHFTFNPCIYRREIIDLDYGYSPQEGVMAARLFAAHPGSCFAFLGGQADTPRVTHIGERSAGRKVTDPRYDPVTNTYRR